MFWVDAKDEKKVLLDNYKEALGQQHCKYFSQVNEPNENVKQTQVQR